MEKIISINFHGRVIPIEESAYNKLKQYIDSLRVHFATEESSDEIINDIENRIAELLSDRLKRGAGCIVGADVNAVIDSIGQLEDIEAAEGEEGKEYRQEYKSGTGNTQAGNGPVFRDRFFRNDDDKVIAGVCSGLAIRTGIDPVIVRILFVLLSGALFWVYMLLWIIVPSKSIQSNITRRLYRNPDDKVLGGVCGGLAAYFKSGSLTIRLIFIVPFIISLLSGGIHALWWHWSWGFGPRIFMGSLSGSFFIGYIILWISLPYASSTADKLEMRGEKVDMNSIKAATQARGGADTYAPVRHRSGFGHIVAVLFKAFFLLIAGSIAIGLFGALIGLVFGGMVAMPFAGFILDSQGQYVLAWTGVALFLGIPLLALITWGVRRLAGIRSRRHYLGYVFGVLWFAGLVCTLTLAGMLASNFSTKYTQEETIPLVQPSGNKLYVNVSNGIVPGVIHYYGRWRGDWDDNDMPFRLLANDSLWLNTVKVKVTQSADSLFHMYKINMSRGNTPELAQAAASHIHFNIAQLDSVINLPRGFAISSKDKFRNQQVMLVVEVPVGKSIKLDRNVKEYEWFSINVHGNRHFHVERHGRNSYYYRGNKEYLMTASGLRRADNTLQRDRENDEDEDDDDDYGNDF